MNSKRTYIATFWRGNLQLKNGSPYITMFGKRLYLINFMRNNYGRR